MTDQNTIIVKPSATQAFETLWKRGRVLFFSAPCGFGKTALADTLLDGRPVLRLIHPHRQRLRRGGAAAAGCAGMVREREMAQAVDGRRAGTGCHISPLFCSQGFP